MADKFTLKASDDSSFEITKEVAKLFTTIENLIIDTVNAGEKDAPIPLPEVTGPILKLALDYCEAYSKNGGVKPLTEEERQDESKYLTVNNWEQEFFSKLNHQTLFDLILAANYLDNKHLLEGACKVVASDMLKKTDDEIRQMWGVTNDFTPEEQALYEEEKKWCAE